MRASSKSDRGDYDGDMDVEADSNDESASEFEDDATNTIKSYFGNKGVGVWKMAAQRQRRRATNTSAAAASSASAALLEEPRFVLVRLPYDQEVPMKWPPHLTTRKMGPVQKRLHHHPDFKDDKWPPGATSRFMAAAKARREENKNGSFGVDARDLAACQKDQPNVTLQRILELFPAHMVKDIRLSSKIQSILDRPPNTTKPVPLRSTLFLDNVPMELQKLLQPQYNALKTIIGMAAAPIPSNIVKRYQQNKAKLNDVIILYKKNDLDNMETWQVHGVCGTTAWSTEHDILLSLQVLDIVKCFPGPVVDIGSGTMVTSVAFSLLGCIVVGLEVDKFRVQKTASGLMTMVHDRLHGNSLAAKKVRQRGKNAVHPTVFTRMLPLHADVNHVDLKNGGYVGARFFAAKQHPSVKHCTNSYNGLLASPTLRYCIISGTTQEHMEWGIDTSLLTIAVQGTHRMKGGNLQEPFSMYITPLGMQELRSRLNGLRSSFNEDCLNGLRSSFNSQTEFVCQSVDFNLRWPYKRKRPSKEAIDK